MRPLKLITIFLLLISSAYQLRAQSLPVGTEVLEDYYRRQQLFEKTDSNVSFTVRPVFPAAINPGAAVFYPDTNKKPEDVLGIKTTRWTDGNPNHFFTLMPLSIQTEFNSNHPYGWNDGPMIPAKGSQTMLSFGFFAQYGPITFQFQPQIVDAANPSFSTFNPIQYDVIFSRYYDIYNNVDLPARFGTQPYQKIFWGQSSIRLNYKALSVGISTENLWWGPGIENSLLMSNTAPGFPHLTLNTTRPIKTPIGSFEGQLIAGALTNSGFPPLEPDHYYFGIDLNVPKSNEWRYLSGIVITWQPKWIPGLFLGFDQSSQTYHNALSGIKDYLPIFFPIKGTTATSSAVSAQDQLNSIFMRWVSQKEHAEVYFEYGMYDNNKDLLQTILEPNASRAYIFGLRKYLPYRVAGDGRIMIGVEVTQLQENSIDNIRNGVEWYVSHAVRSGYTYQGQELGAGVGPGANIQSVDVSWTKGLKKIGFQFERYVHDNDFYLYAFEDSENYSQHWVDLSFALTGSWNYKNLVFNAKLQYISSLNYQWALSKNGDDITFVNQINVPNLHAEAGVSYRF